MSSRRHRFPASLVPALVAIGLGACAGEAVRVPDIGTVQGDGEQSPLAGRSVVVEGIVSGDFQDGDGDRQNDLGGFYLQDERPDGSAATSDGVFVYEERMIVDVSRGDRVEVTGEVLEYYGETQIAAARVTVLGKGEARPVELEFPTVSVKTNADGIAIGDFESSEGMLVRVPGPLTVVDVGDLERHGSLRLHAGGRAMQFTNVHRPDVDGYAAHRAAFARHSLILDDGRRAAYATPIRYLYRGDAGGAGRAIRVGDRVTDLVGIMRYSRGSGNDGFEAFRLVPVAEPAFAAAAPRPSPPARGDGLRVMSFNALNHFTTLDTAATACGPNRLSCRGANTAEELARQRDKLVAAIARADADVVGLMEIENAAGETLASLTAALEDESGNAWRFVDTGVIGGDAIKVGIVYRPDTVEAVGEHAVLDGGVDPDFIDDRNRPSLAQTFEAAGGERLTIVVNHLKSKGSGCEDLGDPDTGDGQGNCNHTRTLAAAALARWLSADPTESGDPDVLIIGDLNAYLEEDPVVALEAAGYVNLLERDIGDDAYSFVFRGESGALDHALASPSLAGKVTAAVAWHSNADEAPVLDYNLENDRDPALFDDGAPWRASDHDPIIIDLEPRPAR